MQTRTSAAGKLAVQPKGRLAGAGDGQLPEPIDFIRAEAFVPLPEPTHVQACFAEQPGWIDPLGGEKLYDGSKPGG